MAEKGKRKLLVGTVVSNKMEKTIVVLVERFVKHHRYGKYIKRTSRFMAHDPDNRCHEGDIVKIVESRPLSRKKRWYLLEIVKTMAEA